MSGPRAGSCRWWLAVEGKAACGGLEGVEVVAILNGADRVSLAEKVTCETRLEDSQGGENG